MPWWNVILVAVGLGMDAMSVSMAVGVRWHGPRQAFRLSWHMGLFQFAMPVVGWAAGRGLADLLRHVGALLAAALVFGIGAKMFYEVLRHRHVAVEEAAQAARGEVDPTWPGAVPVQRKDPTRGLSLIGLCVATSLDALVVGFSLGLRGRGIWSASVVIGLVAAAMALVGVRIGKRFGEAFGWYAEATGAVVLMALGISFLWL